MSTRVFCFMLFLYKFSAVFYCQTTQNVTIFTTTNRSSLTSTNNINITNTNNNNNTSPQSTSAVSPVSADDVTEPSTDPTATYFINNTAQNITDQSTASADPYPFTFTDNPLLNTNRSSRTTASTNESNPWDPINSTVTSTASEGVTDAATKTNPSDCLCDVTPDFCDIGCCCDVTDCGLLNASSVFNGCRQDTGSAVCIESWLIFKTSINPALVTVSGDRFCVQKEEDLGNLSDVQSSPASFQSSYLYPFLLREPTAFNRQKNNFYKVDDIILTYYNSTSIVSTLKQPSSGPASSACINRNPAMFMRSSSLSCSRMVTTRSCVEDIGLSARTYYTGFSLLRVPGIKVEDRPELLVPISTVRDWPEPTVENGSCFNVVSEVEYVIEYTGKGEIVKIKFNAKIINTNISTQLLQNHVVRFQLVTSTSTMATPTPPSASDGLKPGSLMIGWFGEKAQALTVLGSSENGGCSARLANRPLILFRRNTITGCTFRSSAGECGVLRNELMEILTMNAVPELISMTTGEDTQRSKVVIEDCSTPASDKCETGCVLPVALSVRVLWAQRGLRALPQNHILGAKFIFSCQRLKCPLLSSIPVTAEVIFTETTVYPEAARGEAKPEWKFPFGFFSRGAGELDQE